MRIDSGDRSVAGEGKDRARWQVKAHGAATWPLVDVGSLEPGGDEFLDVAAWHRARNEPGTERDAWVDAVDAEEAPVVTAQVPGDEIPPAVRGDQVVRFHVPLSSAPSRGA